MVCFVASLSRKPPWASLDVPEKGWRGWPRLRQEIGDDEHGDGRGCAYYDPGQNVEGKVDAQVDAGKHDEQSGQHQHGGERRVEYGERKGARSRRRRMPRGERARGGRLYQGGYLRVPQKRTGAVEKVLRALGHGPGGGDGDPRDQEPRRLQAREQERGGSQKAPEGTGRPDDGESAHHRRERRPLHAEHGPEQSPVEIPDPACDALQVPPDVRFGGYCRLRTGPSTALPPKMVMTLPTTPDF